MSELIIPLSYWFLKPTEPGMVFQLPMRLNECIRSNKYIHSNECISQDMILRATKNKQTPFGKFVLSPLYKKKLRDIIDSFNSNEIIVYTPSPISIQRITDGCHAFAIES